MKSKILPLVFILLMASFANAQSVHDSVQLRPLLFNHFVDGAVLMKSGAIERASMNYNTDNQSIVFIQDEKYMVLTGLDKVDTVYIDDKRFVPYQEIFYEVATPSIPISLLVSYRNKIKPITATVDHNGGSKQVNSEVSNTMSDTYMSRIFRGNYSVQFIKDFQMRRGNVLFKLKNENNVIKLFPGKEKAIHQFILDNKTDFNSQVDLEKLIYFCNEA